MDLVACCHSVCSHTTRGGEESSSESEPSYIDKDATAEDEDTKADKHRAETAINSHVASDGEEE